MSLPRFIDEPILVQIRWEADGVAQPVAFEWRGRLYVIQDIGRRWDEPTPDDCWRCYLVRNEAGETFELRCAATTASWRLHRAWLRAAEAT